MSKAEQLHKFSIEQSLDKDVILNEENVAQLYGLPGESRTPTLSLDRLCVSHEVLRILLKTAEHEMVNICEKVGADINHVRALISVAGRNNIEPRVLQSVDDVV